MKGKTDVMFGHKGSCENPLVNTNMMAKQVGCAPSTLREWRAGKFPTSLKIFANICKFRGLKPEQVADLVKQFE